jgi:phosphate transport system protein
MSQDVSAQSTRALLDSDLELLKNQLVQMGELVDRAIGLAMDSLVKQDMGLAQKVIVEDAAINELRFRIERLCQKTIATQQPTASDLRAIIAGLNMVLDLERMGDHASGIAKSVVRGEGKPMITIPPEVTHLADQVRSMLQDAMKAYQDEDLELAHEVAARDDDIDKQYRSLFGKLIEEITRKPANSGGGIRLQFASHNLERIADRATNLVERVIYQYSGTMQELNPEPTETDLT